MSYQIYSNSAPTGNVLLGTTYTGAGLYQITGTQNYTLATSASNNSWATITQGSTNTASIQVKGDAEFEGKVRINGQDLAETLITIQRRLAILVPDPKLLDKYQALQQAYEHYKTLEALCVEQNNPEEKQ